MIKPKLTAIKHCQRDPRPKPLEEITAEMCDLHVSNLIKRIMGSAEWGLRLSKPSPSIEI